MSLCALLILNVLSVFTFIGCECIQVVVGCEEITWSCELFIESFIWIAILFFVAFVFFRFKALRLNIMKHLMHAAVCVFFLGVVLYMLGFNWEGSENNSIALLFRSITSSMEMFVSESDLIEVREACKGSFWYMIVFATIHFLAVCISAAFILDLLGIRAISYIKMHNIFNFWKKKDLVMYIFLDLSSESITLAQSILTKKVSCGDKKYRIIFIRTPMEEKHQERFSFSHILNFANNKNEKLEKIIEMDAFLIHSRKNIANLVRSDKWQKVVGLSHLIKYIERRAKTVSFFCMSPDEETNMNTAIYLHERYGTGAMVYSHACKNSINSLHENLNLKIVDSANMSMLTLKMNVEYQPVSFIDADTQKGMARKPFNSLIVGLGETGLEIFKFLYEFGTFVGVNEKDNPFKCYIIDPKVDWLKDYFYMNFPALLNDNSVEFISKEIQQKCLWENITKIITDIDYVVICTGDDKMNISLGVDILNLAYKWKNDTSKFRIFIQTYNKNEYDQAIRIAEYYKNEGKKRDGKLYDWELVPFGVKDELFTYDKVICDKPLERAKTFYFEYEKIAGSLYYNDNKEFIKLIDNKEELWRARRTKKNVGLSNHNELIQKEFQDLANVWHIETKMWLAGIIDPIDDAQRRKLEEIVECITLSINRLRTKYEENLPVDDSLSEIITSISLYKDGKFKKLLENIARCEHLRWCASNKMLGYTRALIFTEGKKNDYIRKEHICLVSNKELEEDKVLRDTVKYDYNTLYVSFVTKKEEWDNIKENINAINV